MTTIEEGDTYRRDVNEAEFAESWLLCTRCARRTPPITPMSFLPWPLAGEDTMTTADKAIEAGAQSLHDDTCADDECGGLHGEDRGALTVARAMWPILSAPLREMHVYHECDDFRECSILFGGLCAKTDHCSHCRYAMPCPTMQAIQRIDKELGND